MKTQTMGDCRGVVEACEFALDDCSNDIIHNSVDVEAGRGKSRAPARPRKPRKSRAGEKKSGKTQQLEMLLEIAAKRKEARDSLLSMMAARRGVNGWSGLMATPPGSLLDSVVAAFFQGTDIPLELPFFSILNLLAAWLLGRGVSIEFAGQTVLPDLWSVVLAPSGAAKTWTVRRLQEIVHVQSAFPEPASAAKYVESLRDYNRSLWLRDEFGQFLRQISQPSGPLAEMRDYLLRTYDRAKIERNTKKEQVVVEDPALVVFGLSVDETFPNQVSAEMLLDGFAQRFCYVIARRDPLRHPIEFPIYDISPFRDEISGAWQRVTHTAAENGVSYRVGDAGVAGFKAAWRNLWGDAVPYSFYRRVMFTAIKYALLYHVILCRPGAEIDEEDMAWAARVCAMHLRDVAAIIDEHGLPELERVLLAAEAIKRRVNATGRPCIARDIVRGVHGIKSTAAAHAVLAMLA